MRTERRREKFAKVLKGREEDGSGVDLGMLPDHLRKFSLRALTTQANSDV